MLIDRYLPGYDFHEFHSVELKTDAAGIYRQMVRCDFSNVLLIRILFWLRGMPNRFYTIEHLTNMGFIKLDEEPGREILFGRITNSPMFNTCDPDVSAQEFMHRSGAIIKAVINFSVTDRSGPWHTISTETRVSCGSPEMKTKFKYYWFVVKPFSQLIRKSMLKHVRNQIMKQGTMR